VEKKQQDIKRERHVKVLRKSAATRSASSPSDTRLSRLFKAQSSAIADVEEGESPQLAFTPPDIDLEDEEAMRNWILNKADEMALLGQIALPTVGWDGKVEGEQEALDRIGFIFAAYKVKYSYVGTLKSQSQSSPCSPRARCDLACET